jgi:ComF family protein
VLDGRAAFHGSNCHDCSTHYYDRAIASAKYDGAIRASILALKSTPLLPDHLIKILMLRIGPLVAPAFDRIIPVPLSAKRKLERGYNQAEIIAYEISRRTGIKLDKNSLHRTGHTAMHRAGMDRRSREATVTGSFEVKRTRMVEGRDILLVDDVMTSGATASACAKELKANGARSVSLFTIGRA